VLSIELVLLVMGEAGEIDSNKYVNQANVLKFKTLCLVLSADFQFI
jgi:hypothetical protein